MNRTERLYQIDRLLRARKTVTRDALLTQLEVSWATLKRDLAYLRDRLGAPIVYDADQRGYRLAAQADAPAPRYALPGLWLNADEAYALLTMHQLLLGLAPGWLGARLGPIRQRIEALLAQHGQTFDQVAQRVRVLADGRRRRTPAHFDGVARALLTRRQLAVLHHSRERDTHTERTLSPQRLTYYRGNWYLEAYCHTRQALRRFAVDALLRVDVLDAAATEVDLADLEAAFGGAYGIYGGAAKHWAVLRFSPESARWVADEQWHPEQRGTRLPDGGYQLEVPYAEPTELVMDILRHGRHVTVLAPPELVQAVAAAR